LVKDIYVGNQIKDILKDLLNGHFKYQDSKLLRGIEVLQNKY